MCCILSCCCDSPADLHFISRIASEDSSKCITGEERVFILKGDKVLEYSQKTGEITETDLRLDKPDYAAIVKQKIDEICANVTYKSNESNPDNQYKTESHVFDKVVEKAKVPDLIKSDIDISSIKIKPVMDFLVNINANEINKFKQVQNYDKDFDEENLDLATICTLGIKILLKNSAPEDVLELKKTILITHLVMQKIDELKAKKAEKKDHDTNAGKQKESEENKKDKDSK